MPSYNFQKWKAEKVESGESRQTIRTVRKNPGANAQPGKPIQLYTGMRGPNCRKLKDHDPVCTEVLPIHIGPPGMDEHVRGIVLAGKLLDEDQAEQVAMADGFDTAEAMFDWFEKTHGLPFSGLLIRW